MNPSVPEEILIEIFSWLPVKSLIRFKCVTKFLNSLVSESDFTDTHRCRSMTRPGGTRFFLRGWKYYYTADHQKEDGKTSASVVSIRSFDELSFNSPQLNCVNGLLCIWERSTQPAAILNLSTREVIFLPNLHDDFSLRYYSLGFEPEENRYKILATTYHVRETYIKHWIFTLGIDESWREPKTFPHVVSFPGVYINGVIYKFVFDDEFAIGRFDVKNENFKFIALMDNLSLSRHYELIEVKGKLGVIDYEKSSNEYINLRVLEQTGKEEKWEHHIIQFPSTWKDIQQEVILSCTFCDGEILFIANSESGTFCLCYDVTRQSWRRIEIKGLPKGSCIKNIYSYVERLVM